MKPLKFTCGIAKGFREGDFAHLDKRTKRCLLILFARIQESSFRRGLQQGHLFASKGYQFKIHPDKLRWGNEPLDSARMPLCGTRMTSLERLEIQHGILQVLGFDVGDLQ